MALALHPPCVAQRAAPAASRRSSLRRGAPLRCFAAARGVSSPDGSWAPSGGGALFPGLLRAATAREPVQAGTPVLRDKARQLTQEELLSERVQDLIEEMVSVCRARGVGLAAPQLGEPLALIVLEDPAKDVPVDEARKQERFPFALKVLANPVVKPKPGAAVAHFFEGCLSVQGYRGLVPRALEVDVTALGGDGKPVAFSARGWLARVLQHEYDHVQGTLYVDRMITRSFRRLDLMDKPLPPPSAEFGACPPEGVAQGSAAGGGGGGQGRPPPRGPATGGRPTKR